MTKIIKAVFAALGFIIIEFVIYICMLAIIKYAVDHNFVHEFLGNVLYFTLFIHKSLGNVLYFTLLIQFITVFIYFFGRITGHKYDY